MKEERLELNFEQLRMLTGEDADFMIEILEIIEDQSPEVLEEMKEQLAKGDYSSLSATAHKYKSSINILGNLHLNNIVKDLEDKAKNNKNWDELEGLIFEFEGVCDKLLDAVRDELDSLRD